MTDMASVPAKTVNKERVSSPKGALKPKSEAKKLPMFDLPFFFAVILLLIVGIIVLFSAGYAQSLSKTGDSYTYIRGQVRAAFIGIIGLFTASVIPAILPKKWYRLAIFAFYGISVFLLALVLVVSKDSEKRWLYIGSFHFQPSEFAKLAVIMMLAVYISTFKDKMNRMVPGVIIPGCLFGICVVLVGVETHLSGAILIAAIGYIMIRTGGCRFIHVLPFIAAGASGAAALIALNKYMQNRITIWLNPDLDPVGLGFQPLQSMLTIGSGGLFGLGYGKSRQKYLFLPEPQNDFISSVMAEELGYVGIILIMLLFVFLIWRGIYIALHARNTFESMLVIGIISKVAVQTILNFAVVSNSIPTTGISLPFFSYGGTALVVLLAEMGLVLHASRYAYLDTGGGEA